MDLNNLLNSVLSSGQKVLNNNPQQQSGGMDFLKSFGGGAAAAGLLGLLMGNKGGRGGLSGNLAKFGSLATLGTLAYKAYQSWQTQDGQSTTAGNIQPTHQRSATQQEQSAEIILLTMIAAANADGRIDPQERDAILNEIGHDDHEAKAWLEQQLSHPLSAKDIAARIGADHALAAESYLAARIVCGDLDRKEIIFLYELSDALQLDEQLVDRLEAQAGFTQRAH